MANRLALRDLLTVGARTTWRYTGTLLAVFVVQAIITAACIVSIAMILYAQFGALPMWDDAVDGDLVSLLWCLKHGAPSFIAIFGVVIGALLLWQLTTWFIVGGINGVLVQRPEGRAETARCFGSSGATTYLAYARLALYSLPGYVAVLIAFIEGTALAGGGDRLVQALTLSQLVGALLLMFGPGLVVLHVVWTITDYARVELTLRGESHDPGVVMTYFRTIMYVLKRPLTLVHAGLGWIALLFVTIVYVYFAQGHPMYGAEGAVALFVIREGVALARTAIRFSVIAGQIELGKTRPLPPMRIKVDVQKSS